MKDNTFNLLPFLPLWLCLWLLTSRTVLRASWESACWVLILIWLEWNFPFFFLKKNCLKGEQGTHLSKHYSCFLVITVTTFIITNCKVVIILPPKDHHCFQRKVIFNITRNQQAWTNSVSWVPERKSKFNIIHGLSTCLIPAAVCSYKISTLESCPSKTWEALTYWSFLPKYFKPRSKVFTPKP